MKTTHIPPVNRSPHMVTHVLDVVHPLGHHLSRIERNDIMDMPGIQMIICNVDSGHIEVTYDLKMIHLDSIEEHLLELGYMRKGDPFHRIRNGLAHFVERNEMGHH